MRASFLHAYGGNLDMSVVLESGDGMSLNAASVIVTPPGASPIMLGYDSDSCRYEASMPAVQDGSYRIAASSLGMDEEMALDVPFVSLKTRPIIEDVSDSMGASASAGQALSGGASILVEASPVEGASGYRLDVYRTGSLAFSSSSATFAVAIPAGTLAAGSYSACVVAQAISGDPLLSDAPYIASSMAASALFAFQVEP